MEMCLVFAFLWVASFTRFEVLQRVVKIADILCYLLASVLRNRSIDRSRDSIEQRQQPQQQPQQ